jgi:hypothetical protein
MCIKEVLGGPSSGLSVWRPWFDFRPVCMHFVMAKVTFELVFSEYLAFLTIVSFHQCSILVFGFVRLLLELKGDEAWKLSNKIFLCRISWSSGQKSTSTLLI